VEQTVIYHFNMHDGRAYPDTLGTECLTLDAARFWTGDEWTMDVTDGNGLTLFSLVFMAANSPAVGLR
jgi:hypothetical protein